MYRTALAGTGTIQPVSVQESLIIDPLMVKQLKLQAAAAVFAVLISAN